MSDSLFDGLDLTVLGAALITAALVGRQASATVDSSVATFNSIAKGIKKFVDEEMKK